MDTRTLTGLLAATPPVNLRIIELTAELTRPDGSLDLDAAAARQPEVELACAQAQDYASSTGRLLEALRWHLRPPALLSGLPGLLLRRPPSLRDLVTVAAHADDYAWFVGLVRRLFPDEAEATLSAPDVPRRVERFANLFAERHFPLYGVFIDLWADDGDDPPWSWLRQGIPFDLMGFGYDGLHEMWNGYRERPVGPGPADKPPRRSTTTDPDGLRTAWLESAAERIPQQTLERIPQGGIPVESPHRGCQRDGVRGSGPGRLVDAGRDRQLLLGRLLRGRLLTTASPTPGRRRPSPRARRSGAGPAPSWTRCSGSPTGWRRTFRPASPRCWTPSCPGCPNQQHERRTTNMTTDVEKTEWSLPGATDVPRDELQLQMEVYKETILLRGFEGETNWVRTVSADEIANAFIQHLGFSSGLLPQDALWWGQGETGHTVALWRPPQVWPVALQREAFKPPARLQASHAGAGLRLLAGPRPLGLRRPWSGQRPGAAPLPDARPSTSSGTGGSAPEATSSPRRWDAYRSPSSSPSSRSPGTPGSARRSTPTTCNRYGRSSMERLSTLLRTWFPSAPWPTRWRPPRADVATAGSAPRPVGYLVNHPTGLVPALQGIGYDYVLGAGGLYVQSESAHLTARVLVAPCTVRGLAPVREGGACPRPHPGPALRDRAALVPGRPRTPSGSSPCGGTAERLPAGGPEQEGTATSLEYTPPAGVVAEFHSHGSSRAFFSKTDDGTSRASASTASWDASTPYRARS